MWLMRGKLLRRRRLLLLEKSCVVAVEGYEGFDFTLRKFYRLSRTQAWKIGGKRWIVGTITAGGYPSFDFGISTTSPAMHLLTCIHLLRVFLSLCDARLR